MNLSSSLRARLRMMAPLFVITSTLAQANVQPVLRSLRVAEEPGTSRLHSSTGNPFEVRAEAFRTAGAAPEAADELIARERFHEFQTQGSQTLSRASFSGADAFGAHGHL